MKEMLLIALPVIMSAAVNEINIPHQQNSSRIAEGGIRHLNYANRLNGFVQGLFDVRYNSPLPIFKMASKATRKPKAYLAEAISMVGLW